MKKALFLLLSTVVLLPGCGWNNKSKDSKKPTRKHKKVAFEDSVNIPICDEEIRSYFDDDVSEFVLEDDFDTTEDIAAKDLNIDGIETAAADIEDDFFWIEDIDTQEDTFKNVYFEFDNSDVNNDQEEYVQHNIDIAQRIIKEGNLASITIEGHACSSAGSRNYNLAISNSRAEKVAHRFVECGIPQECVKIVGRGVDVPALNENGNPVTGDKNTQWANRRVEIKVYQS